VEVEAVLFCMLHALLALLALLNALVPASKRGGGGGFVLYALLALLALLAVLNASVPASRRGGGGSSVSLLQALLALLACLAVLEYLLPGVEVEVVLCRSCPWGIEVDTIAP
jgi:hypothetical protein